MRVGAGSRRAQRQRDAMPGVSSTPSRRVVHGPASTEVSLRNLESLPNPWAGRDARRAPDEGAQDPSEARGHWAEEVALPAPRPKDGP